MKTPLPRRFLFAGVLIVAACADRETPIPRPSLEAFTPSARQQVEEAQARLEGALGDATTAPASLAAFWGDLGNVYHAYEQIGAARDCYRSAQRLVPKDPRWPYFLGRLEVALGDPQAGIAALRRAAELAPDQPAPRIRLGEALLAVNRLTEARPEFTAALNQAAGSAPAAVGLAKIALAENRLDEARELLLQALKDQPGADAIHHVLASVYRRQGQAGLAERHLKLGGPRQPKVPDPWFEHVEALRLGSHNLMTRAQKAFRAERLDEAIAVYEAVVAAEPGHLRAWTNLGTALTRQGHHERAAAAFERALEIEPSDPLALFNLGTLRLRSGDPRALALLEAAVKADPRNPGARLNLGTALRRADRFEDAAAQYDALITIAPANTTARYWQALTRIRLGRFASARAGLEEAIAVDPGSVPLRATLARLLASCSDDTVRDGRAALAQAHQVMGQAPSWEHRRILAMALAETGDFSVAGEQQRRVVEEAESLRQEARVIAALRREEDHYRHRRPLRLSWWEPAEIP